MKLTPAEEMIAKLLRAAIQASGEGDRAEAAAMLIMGLTKTNEKAKSKTMDIAVEAMNNESTLKKYQKVQEGVVRGIILKTGQDYDKFWDQVDKMGDVEFPK